MQKYIVKLLVLIFVIQLEYIFIKFYYIKLIQFFNDIVKCILKASCKTI
jgi:hypothetical protein